MDPLQHLGPSIFLQIISELPILSITISEQVTKSWKAVIRTHEKGVWRRACGDVGLPRRDLKKLEEAERSLITSRQSGNAGSDPVEHESVNQVDWRALCKERIQTGFNWKYIRSRQRWITAPDNAVWRIKVDPENNTLLSSCTDFNANGTGALYVVDLDTSEELFHLEGVLPYAHLEFDLGFAAFTNADNSIEIWRTQQAIDRSNSKSPSKPLSRIATNHERRHPPTADQRLPRGHMSFWRKIIPPTPFRASKTHIDQRETPDERAVLALAGPQGIHIYDIDDPKQMWSIPVVLDPPARINYIDLDDDFVFLCTNRVIVYSRHTLSLVAMLPVQTTFSPVPANLRYVNGKFNDVVRNLDRGTTDSTANPPLVPVKEAVTIPFGTTRTVEDARGMEVMSMLSHQLNGTMNLGVIACHYTTSDLIYINGLNEIVILRDYKNTLHYTDLGAQTQEEHLISHTLSLRLHDTPNHLATHGDRVAITTREKLYILDCTTLPRFPHDIAPPPTFKIYSLQGNSPSGVEDVSCLQMDADKVYMTYDAMNDDPLPFIEESEVYELFVERGYTAGDDIGSLCIKVWDFKP